MGKTRDLFTKIRDTKGTFHANMGSIKAGTAMMGEINENIQERLDALNIPDFEPKSFLISQNWRSIN